MSLLQIGFFHDFKSNDTLLLDGDSDGLRLLADNLDRLVAHGARLSIHKLPFVSVHDDLRLVATRGDRAEVSIVENQMIWRGAREDWTDTVEKLQRLVLVKSGHHYLVDSGAIVVMASIGEYGRAWWDQNR